MNEQEKQKSKPCEPHMNCEHDGPDAICQKQEAYTLDEAVRDITKVGVCPASKSAVREIIERLLSAKDAEIAQAKREERERVKSEVIGNAILHQAKPDGVFKGDSWEISKKALNKICE